jgi:polyribonucleotide nucleotidyltransferase
LLGKQVFEHEIGGRKLIIQTGGVADQANAAATVSYGDTVVLVTVCISDGPREGVDFLPLTIDYEERLYAVGKIPGSFIRREGRPSQEAILACRLTDRPLRALIPKDWRRDIQVIITVLSADQENDPDILAVLGSSAVLTMSQVPFQGPVGAVRVGYINSELVLNPTMGELEESDLDLVVASTKDRVVMLEAGANEVPEDIIAKAIQFGHEANQAIVRLQEEAQQACGKPKEEAPTTQTSSETLAMISPLMNDKLLNALKQESKEEREQALSELKAGLLEHFGDSISEGDLNKALDTQVGAEIRSSLLDKGKRVNGRGLTQVRPITCEVGLLPRTHGSAIFTRGETQVLAITTLGSTRQEQQLDGLGIEETKRFIHHYNFTPFSTGEVRRMGIPGRREIGHGALVERSLEFVLPEDEEFPYTIRLVSEVLSSSGSTSMASACASSMSLMDAGVPIRKAVAGIAMGLITDDKDDRYVILTDIEGLEDAYGDMDFKVAGTADGITGLQMDTKIKGLTMEIVEKTLTQAREARLFILDIMNQTIGSSRSELSQFAPRMYRISIPPDKIGSVIGPGGRTIRSITEETKTTIDIQNDGSVTIGSVDAEGAQRALETIESLTREVEVGEVYTGKVSRILNFGAMVEILPGKEGLVHISELADYRVGSVEDVVKIGDEVMVKAIGIDNLGRINLSRKAVPDKPSEASASNVANTHSSPRPPRPQREDRPDRDRWRDKKTRSN